jgi:hypothetical protein
VGDREQQWRRRTDDLVRIGQRARARQPHALLRWHDWIAQPGLQDYDYYAIAHLDATGPCHAVGGGFADIVGERRAIALELKPIVFGNRFE